MTPKHKLIISELKVLVAILSIIPFLGNVNFIDWDDINFAESLRKMIFSGNFGSILPSLYFRID